MVEDEARLMSIMTGDRRAERTDSGDEAGDQARRAAAALRSSRSPSARMRARIFGRNRISMVKPKSRKERSGSKTRHAGKARTVREIIGLGVLSDRREGKPGGKQEQPQWRGQIRHDALDEVNPACPMESRAPGRSSNAGDCPGTSARSRQARSSSEGGGPLHRSRQGRQHKPAQPARRMRAASTKSWLRNMPAKGLRPSARQPRRFGERAGVRMMRYVAPVIAVAACQAANPAAMTGP